MKNCIMFATILLSSFILMSSCHQLSIEIIDDPDTTVWEPLPLSDSLYREAINTIHRRANQISGIRWTALADVPNNVNSFSKGVTIKGVPYSSVKELDKFVGHEVSFYTFLTAAQNPKSVLYTENVGQFPYKGVNCACYYGTVCSMTVNYVLGIDCPYQTDMYAGLPFIEEVVHQDVYHIRIGDILWKKGHVVLIEDIEYDDNNSDSVFAENTSSWL